MGIIIGLVIIASIFGSYALEEKKDVKPTSQVVSQENEKPKEKTAPKAIGQLADGIIPKEKVLGAGKYNVGTEADHLTVGRYKVTSYSRHTHLVVYDYTGGLKVNILIGKSDMAAPDYTFEANIGDRIECGGKVKFKPIN